MSDPPCPVKPGSPECLKCDMWIAAWSRWSQGEPKYTTYKCLKELKEKWK